MDSAACSNVHGLPIHPMWDFTFCKIPQKCAILSSQQACGCLVITNRAALINQVHIQLWLPDYQPLREVHLWFEVLVLAFAQLLKLVSVSTAFSSHSLIKQIISQVIWQIEKCSNNKYCRHTLTCGRWKQQGKLQNNHKKTTHSSVHLELLLLKKNYYRYLIAS